VRVPPVALLVALCSGCATPRPIVDTATLVGKMATQINDAVGGYVKQLQSARSDDADRLARTRARAAALDSVNRDQEQIWRVQNIKQPGELLSAIAAGSPTQSDVRAGGLMSTPVATIHFDGSPLQAVSKVAAQISAPKSAKDEFTVLEKFGEQVKDDVKSEAKTKQK